MSFDLADVLKGVSNLGTERKQIEYIRLDLIDGDPNNFYQLSGIEELAANIATCDLQQPLLVREKEDGRYIIVSGHRRRAALELLAKEDPERWQEVSCIVERDTASPALQQLRLIYANANTRTVTSAELGEQAARVEKLLYQLKEEGYEFPGRMRDHVAQAVNASKSKLARLKVIREKLIPQFMRLWETNRLRESVAYTLAGLSKERQRMIFIAQTNDNKNAFRCTDGWIDNIARNMDRIETMCKETKCAVCNTSTCGHKFTRLDQAAKLGMYNSMFCRGCCLECTALADCKYSCEHAADAKSVLRDKRRADKKAEKEAQLAKEQPEKDLLALAYSRVGQLRKERNISAEDFVTASLGWHYAKDMERLSKLEDGSSVSLNDRMPGSIWAREAKRLIETADLLGCSIDYMLGRDVPDRHADFIEERYPGVFPGGTPENVPNLGTGWRTGTPDAEGEYIVLVKYNPNGYYLPDKYQWTGEEWLDCGESVADAYIIVDYWTPIPPDIHHPELVPEQDPEPEQAFRGDSCITGISDSGRCGSAAYCDEPFDCCLQCGDLSCSLRCGWICKENDGDAGSDMKGSVSK